MKRVPKKERASRVDQALEMVQLSQLGARSPRQLSGGQQQRVALARALVNRPRVLLLDEPLGALDLKLRKGMQLELKHLQTSLGITFVYVTHDQEEALTMSDRIVLMRQGRIAQVGAPRDLYDRPASRYVADFIGETNLLGGTVVESRNGEAALRIGVDVLRGISDGVLETGHEAWLAVRPEAIAVRPPEGLGRRQRRVGDSEGSGLRRLGDPGARDPHVGTADRRARAGRHQRPRGRGGPARVVYGTESLCPGVRHGPSLRRRCPSGSSPSCSSSRMFCCSCIRSGVSRVGRSRTSSHSRTTADFSAPISIPTRSSFRLASRCRVTLFSLLLAYPLAYLLAFKVRRHKQLMYMAVIIPLWVSYLVRAYAWKIILGQEGILNGLLQAAGLIDHPLTFLLYSRWAVILALTHIYTPFTLMPIYAVLEAIPPALKEASQDLYASRWQTFLRVILPLSLPGVLAGSTFAFVLSMGDFLAPQLLGGNDSALMVSNLVWSLFGVAYNWPLGAAVSVVVLLLTLFLLWLANRVETAMNYSGQEDRMVGSVRGGAGGMTRRGSAARSTHTLLWAAGWASSPSFICRSSW